MSSNALTFSSPPKPTQFEPTLSAHAVNSMDWIARLASETANRVLSVATTIANGACATYGPLEARAPSWRRDRKSTRLNSSHLVISYAVFCLKKKKTKQDTL